MFYLGEKPNLVHHNMNGHPTMKLIRSIIFLLGMITASCGTQHINLVGKSTYAVESNIFSNEKEGLWMIDEERSIMGEGQILTPAFHNTIFKFDGTYITMRLFFWSWTPYSEDGFYKLKTKWSNDTLLYLSPLSVWEPDWVELGVYKNKTYTSNYVNGNGDSCKWVYRKISMAEVSNADKAVLIKRELFKYSTQYWEFDQ